VKVSSKIEVVDYLTETLSHFKKIRDIANQRNKTNKIKGILSIILVVEARLDSSLKYIKSGGEYDSFPVIMQKSLYDPIIEFFINELTQ
jgi:hypothetical protein